MLLFGCGLGFWGSGVWGFVVVLLLFGCCLGAFWGYVGCVVVVVLLLGCSLVIVIFCKALRI